MSFRLIRSNSCGHICLWLFLGIFISLWVSASAQTLPHFDFLKGQTAAEWKPAHDVSEVKPTTEGLRIAISGNDPYIIGPAHNYSPDQSLWLRIRLKSQQGGTGQIFFFSKNATEEDSVRFPVHGGGKWEETRLPLPPLGPDYRLRFDPPGDSGVCVLASIEMAPRKVLDMPKWPALVPPDVSRDAMSVQSGDLELVQAHHQFGGFVLKVAGKQMAVGMTRPLLGYIYNGVTRYVSLADGAIVTACRNAETICSRLVARDKDGGNWEIQQVFSPGKSGSIHVMTMARVDQDRDVVLLPMFMILPGVGSFGEKKNQALFGGLEYLDKDELSSSEADIKGPGALRETPDAAKITLPLMVVQEDDRYIGLMWQPTPNITALFDSPDRQLHVGGHVMGLLFPGSDGDNRAAGSLLPYEGAHMKANSAQVVQSTILGGHGASVVPAVRQAVMLHGLPPLPDPGLKWPMYESLVAAGWLDSAIHKGDQFQHAYPNFEAQPASDAATILEYLSQQTKNPAQAEALGNAGRAALAATVPDTLDFSGVGHVQTFAPALIFGHVRENAKRADQIAKELLSRFEPDGTVHFRQVGNSTNLASTHFAPDANGLTAQVVVSLLEAAALSGDRDLIEQGIKRLHALDKFKNTAPRGAQSWEVPLHTPDILAAAYLVRAYTLGYQLTGQEDFLEQARYWAWTGVPFVYLYNPTGERVGPYATIAVYGATQWIAPNWMGLPVQWCGLVYADALYKLEPFDPEGPWKRLADGITASGIQQTWPKGSDRARQGLLPDSFDLKQQNRNDPAINPATLFVNAVRFYDRPNLADFYACKSSRLLIHAPGTISHVEEKAGHVVFGVEGWSKLPYMVQIGGLKSVPKVHVNGKEVSLTTPNDFATDAGRLILQVKGNSSIRLDLHP